MKLNETIITYNKYNIKLCKECGVELIRQEGCNSLNCPICNYGGCS